MTDAEIRGLFQHIGAPKAVRLGKDNTGAFAGYYLAQTFKHVTNYLTDERGLNLKMHTQQHLHYRLI